MFWTKDTVNRKEFQDLFAKFENLRIEVEGVKLDLALYKNKLMRKAGLKEDKEEIETNKNPEILLNPNGTTLKH